jgi:hypothetical protein
MQPHPVTNTQHASAGCGRPVLTLGLGFWGKPKPLNPKPNPKPGPAGPATVAAASPGQQPHLQARLRPLSWCVSGCVSPAADVFVVLLFV